MRHATARVVAHRRAGKRLLRLKGRLGHGSFQAFVRAHFDFAPATARRYMALAKMEGLDTKTLTELSVLDIQKCDRVLSHDDTGEGDTAAEGTQTDRSNSNTNDEPAPGSLYPPSTPGAYDGQTPTNGTPRKASNGSRSRKTPSAPAGGKAPKPPETPYQRFVHDSDRLARDIDDLGLADEKTELLQTKLKVLRREANECLGIEGAR
jgi:hypothetical protein